MTSSLASDIHKLTNDAKVCAGLVQRLNDSLNGKPLRFMEVCGTHTTAIFQSGLRAMLPGGVTHLSGPGCPVCVTHESEVEAFLKLAEEPQIVIATFGDLIRVPGNKGNSLKHAQANGAQIKIIYSPLEAVALAEATPGKEIVFLGAGFETTAPATAAAVITASRKKLGNFSVLSLHKLVPPALLSLLREDNGIDAFLLPGHVAAITGLSPFSFLADEFAIPGAVSGFEPMDILLALCELAEAHEKHKPVIKNCYARAVSENGNPQARKLLEAVFELADANWRGLGLLPKSGLRFREEFQGFDALKKFSLELPKIQPIPGCKCGEILKGRLSPGQCPLFGKKCTPASPVGPCMVSTEGSCAAHFKYGDAGE